MSDPENREGEALPSPEDEAPPLGTWNALYALILAALAIQIVIYALLTRWAS